MKINSYTSAEDKRAITVSDQPRLTLGAVYRREKANSCTSCTPVPGAYTISPNPEQLQLVNAVSRCHGMQGYNSTLATPDFLPFLPNPYT